MFILFRANQIPGSNPCNVPHLLLLNDDESVGSETFEVIKGLDIAWMA